MTESVAIVGSGLIGRAWAMIFARAGWDVRLFDAAAGVAEAAVPLCAEGLRTLAANGLCPDPEGAAAPHPGRGDSRRCSRRASTSCRRTGRSGST